MRRKADFPEKKSNMKAKKNGPSFFRCSVCGYTQPRWLGRCPSCGEWNTFEETTGERKLPGPDPADGVRAVPLAAVEEDSGIRLETGIGELDLVLGGGAMRRSAVLFGGEPGIGKSTLLLQAASSVAARQTASGAGRVLYISGEESAGQIKARARRICGDGGSRENIELLCTNQLTDIMRALQDIRPLFVIVDSIQTVYSAQAGTVPGTVTQLKYCAQEMISWVKERDAVLFLVAHVTKEGAIAGPKTLEHMVDAVISFERNADDVRFLRAYKNRFGSVDELGVFQMTGSGLTAVGDPASIFLTRRNGVFPPGIAVAPVFEGSRVFPVEIQALTVTAKSTVTRVFSDKIESARVSRIAAVLEKRAGIRFSDQDIYVNVAGGIRLTESAVDLALAAALYSARTDLPAPDKTAFIGEISLAGEIRPVPKLRQRVKAAESLGFSAIAAPEKAEHCLEIKTVRDMIRLFAAAPAQAES